MTDLVVERKGQADRTVNAGGVLLAPLPDEGYWLYRVRVGERQAVVGFPKFGVLIGVGFAIEGEDWNTNLPANVPAEAIYAHIAKNQGDESIPRERCVEAIRLIQEAAIADGRLKREAMMTPEAHDAMKRKIDDLRL